MIDPMTVASGTHERDGAGWRRPAPCDCVAGQIPSSPQSSGPSVQLEVTAAVEPENA
jgi:hypothetical protein